MSPTTQVLFLLVILTFPVYLVLRLGWPGIIAGGAVVWVMGLLAQLFSPLPYATQTGMDRGAWTALGLPFSLLYCCALYALCRLGSHAFRTVFGKRQDSGGEDDSEKAPSNNKSEKLNHET